MTDEELIAELEAAESGAMYLDAEIWKHVAGDQASALDIPPAYTVSLDCALRLVPDGAWLRIQHQRGWDTHEKTCSAGFDIGQSPYAMYATAATLPLAMCLAALKWRAIQSSPTA